MCQMIIQDMTRLEGMDQRKAVTKQANFNKKIKDMPCLNSWWCIKFHMHKVSY